MAYFGSTWLGDVVACDLWTVGSSIHTAMPLYGLVLFRGKLFHAVGEVTLDVVLYLTCFTDSVVYLLTDSIAVDREMIILAFY